MFKPQTIKVIVAHKQHITAAKHPAIAIVEGIDGRIVLVVAAVQSSIAAVAALGGLLFGISGVTGIFITAGCIMFLASLVIGLKVRVALT